MLTKVALIDPVAARGGSHHFYLFGQAKGLINHNIEVTLFTNSITKNPDIKNLNVYHYYKGIFDRKSNIIAGIFYLIGSIRSIFHAKFIGANICHYHLFHINILTVFDLFLSKLLGMKVVYTIHDVISNLEKNTQNKWLINFVLKFSDKILTHNHFSKQQIQDLFDYHDDDIGIIPHGNYIPFIKLEKNQEFSRQYLGISKNKKVLLFFGMIKRIKGLEILLSALEKVIKLHPDILLVIAGKTWEGNFKIYQEIIDKYNLNRFCIVRNKYIPSNDVNHYFAAADLVILPYKRISQSGVLMMAVSYQKAVLTSDLPPFKEVLSNDKTGFLFQSENIDSLANKIIQIFNEDELLKTVSEAGYELIDTAYNWNVIGEALKTQYLKL